MVGLSGIVRVLASARQHSLAIESDGTLWMWGRSVGAIPEYDPAIPTRIPALPGIVDIAGGGYAVSNVDWIFVLALDEDGELWNWSRHTSGAQLPTKMTSFGSPVAVGTNPFGTFLVLLDDGTVWAWGSNSWGNLGNGDEEPTYHADPAQIASLTGIVSIHTGVDHTLAMDENGDLWAWGRNNFGQLGDGTTETRYVPVAVTVLDSAP